MIPNITHSTGSGNYLGYDLGDKKEQYQKVQFLAAEGVMFDDRLIDRLNQNWADGDEKGYQAFRKVSMAIANDLDDQFRAQASLNGRPKIRAINVSLSYSPEDTDKVNEVVYDETRDDYVPLRLKMGREFLDGMGFCDIQYVAVSHLGTHCAHDHYAINTVRADGTTIKLNFDFVRAQEIAAKIRQKYGLTPPDESLQMITPKAKDALKQSCSWDEYKQRLQEYGIGLVYTDHSKNGRSYGVSYSFNKKVIPGSKLHRSLSYGQVDATLARNLAARQTQEEASRIAAQQELARQQQEARRKAEVDKVRDMIAGCNSVIPPMCRGEVSLLTIRNNAYHLMKAAKDAGIAVSKETTAKFGEIKVTWAEFKRLDQEARTTKDAASKTKALGGLIMLLNPIIGLTVMFLAKVSNDIRQADIKAQKKQLLAKVESIRSEINQLQQQKAQLKIEKQERLQEYLDAKRMLTEYQEGLRAVDETLHDARIDMLKEEFPFRDNGHMQYIIYGHYDAALFRSKDYGNKKEKIEIEESKEWRPKYELARQALKEKVLLVAGDEGPTRFYEILSTAKEDSNFRVGDIQIHPDGKITFGQERIFGDPSETEPYMPEQKKPVVRESAPVAVNKPSAAVAPAPTAKPVQPAATPALPDLIHITVENAFTVKLPNGYGVFNKNGHQYLGTPTVAGQEIRGDGIYLERRKNGSWHMYPPGTYEAKQKPKERAEEPKKTNPNQSRGPKF